MSDANFKESNYIPTLDGWRAVSIGLVILHHSQVTCAVPVLGTLLRGLGQAGEVGVEVFFAISGLLICSRLLGEESRTGKISIRNFYLRRFFRILPAAFLYLAAIALLAAFHVVPLLPSDWFAALLFFRNYAMLWEFLHHSPLALHWYTGHFWSLSMEEHFYLLLPGILVLFRRARLRILGGLAASVALWRLFLTYVLHCNYEFGFRTDTHLDALLIPTMIALVLYPVMRNQKAVRYLPAWSFFPLLALEVLLLATHIPFSFTLQAMVIPMLILSTVLHPGTFPGACLEWLPVRWIGWISYSLYLWQQLFFGTNMVGSPPALATLRAAPASFAGLAVCALFSYYAVEKPCIRFGHKFVQALNQKVANDRGYWHGAKRNETCGPLPPKSRINTAS